LGYPAGMPPLVRGAHQVFAHPPGFEGESRFYLNGWMTFRLFTSFNHGALWGMGQGLTWMFSTLSLVAIAGVLYWLFVHGAARSLWLTVSLALVMAGTLGNLYDRLGMHGYVDQQGVLIRAVRDFLFFTFGKFHWPVFNFADSFLVTGAIILVLQSFVPQRVENDAAAGSAAGTQEPAAQGVTVGNGESPA
jgi:signal peptidase II